MKKGKKRTFVLGAAFVASVSFAACGKVYASPPDYYDDLTPTVTESPDSAKKGPVLETVGLEFEIAQKIEFTEFDGHDEIYGWFGAREFLGKEYKAVSDSDEDGMATRPEVYVSYIVTAYPDYSSEEQAVTEIRIMDPKVSVFGHNIDTPVEEFDNTLREKGFTIEQIGEGTRRKATKGDITISYGGGQHIQIDAEVTNAEGIVF